MDAITCTDCTPADRCHRLDQHGDGCCCAYPGGYWVGPDGLYRCDSHALQAELAGDDQRRVETWEQAATRQAWEAQGIGAN
jgi:hypothetical protein